MIQRIQTLFLIFVTGITALLFFMPVANLTVADTFSFEFFTTKVIKTGENPEFFTWNYMSLALVVIALILSLFTIFLYKKRLFQLRLCVVNIILQLGLFIIMWLQVGNMTKVLEATKHFSIGFCFPLISTILLWLAIRGIIKDIALLKSFDRIR